MGVIRELKLRVAGRAERVLDAGTVDPNPATSDERSSAYEQQLQEAERGTQRDALRVAQAELDRSREQFGDLFELSPVAYLGLNAHARIVQANRAACELIGVERERLLGERFASLIAGEHAERFAGHRRSVFSGGTRPRCELEVECGGQRRSVRLESIRTSGAAAEWLMALVDLTERRKLEQDLQEVRRLEAVATLVSGVAHDFNNLLMGVLGCSDLALERLDAGSAAHAPVSAIRDSVLRGRSVVAQLMAFASAAEPPDALISDLNAVVNGSLPVLRHVLGERIEVRSRLRAQDAHIRADATQVRQILLNLASNARDAMPEGGVFTLETVELETESRARRAGDEPTPQRRVRLCASDDGRGMDKKTAARAFEPFFTTKPLGAGTGLGLSMVYGAVRQARGRIELHSQPGKGTSVLIDWPLAGGAAAAATSNPPRTRRAEAKVRVLVVEDDRLVRLTMRHYLEKAGYEVLEAATGEEGVELLHQPAVAPRVLVSDVVLPGIKGPQVVAVARACCPDIGVLLVSAHAPDLLSERGFTLPGTPVLQKPFTAEDLCGAVSRSLRQRASAD